LSGRGFSELRIIAFALANEERFEEISHSARTNCGGITLALHPEWEMLPARAMRLDPSMRTVVVFSPKARKLTVVLAAIFFAAAWTVFRPSPSKADSAGDNATPNPHWQADGCASCHKMVNDKPQAITAAAIDRTCLKCHDGEHASAEIHPIARPLDVNRYTLPPQWPLVEGRLSCVTCHDIRSACKALSDTPPQDPMFLRNRENVDLNNAANHDFCQYCHTSSAKRFNPHLVLDSNQQVIENRCLFCHEKVPDHNSMNRSGNSQLRFPQIVLCKSCHPNHKEILKGGHLDVKVKDDFAAYMRAREIVGLLGEPSVALLTQLKAQHARPTHMYLEPDGGVMCATCHNPHPEGLFPIGSALYYRAMHVQDGRPISPVHEQSFCRNCHRM